MVAIAERPIQTEQPAYQKLADLNAALTSAVRFLTPRENPDEQRLVETILFPYLGRTMLECLPEFVHQIQINGIVVPRENAKDIPPNERITWGIFHIDQYGAELAKEKNYPWKSPFAA